MAAGDKNSSSAMPSPLLDERTRLRVSGGSGLAGLLDSSACAALVNSLKPRDPSVREFDYTDHDFERVKNLIYKRAGIALTSAKQDMVYSRLARRLRSLGMTRFSQYLDELEKGHLPGEWEAFTNALTTNLTSFFREEHHFVTLAEHIGKITEKRPIRIWCCAASTGEEPYSIAMTVQEKLGANASVQIIASDLDTNVLMHGQKGFYTTDRFDKMSPERVKRFFMATRSGVTEGFQARRELQQMINFQRVNLLDSTWPVRGPFDAIFCRNVMIYFDKQTQYQILERFAPLLREDGLLFAGHSENFIHAAKIFRSLGRTVYARADRAAPQSHTKWPTL